jgi:putative transposase
LEDAVMVGAVAGGIAPGVALRHDHGSPFVADHFQNQIKFWSMAPSFAFVAEPKTNGVTECFFRPFKEQVVFGRIYQTINDVRAAVSSITSGSSRKNGLRSPHQSRIA